MAVAAILFGMDPAPVEHCRVLEIGCNQGGNLIPMAFGLPESEFTGIDLAPGTIARAQSRIERIGLTNIRVHAMNLLDVGPDLGEFDYIVAHGLYSWVPAPVREKLLTVCRQNLSANGVAYVSYNTYPAGHLRRVSRDAMQFHAARAGLSGEERVREGKAFLKFLLDSADADGIGKAVYQNEFERQFKRDDEGVFHDELSADYSPFYFTDVAEAAARYGLQFLSEARLRDMLNPAVKPEALQMAAESAGGDLIAYHQYLDFLVFRGFRETLLCHGEARLRRDGLAERMGRMWVASPLRKFGQEADGTTEFRVPRGAGSIRTNNPATIAALERLQEIWPQGERFQDLLETTRSEARESLEQAFLQLAAMGLADLRTHCVSVAAQVSDRPTASRLARMEAQEGDVITTLLHRSIRMEDEPAKRFIQLLDGAHGHEALVDCLAADFPAVPRDTIDAQVRSNLLELCRSGVLAG
ncbi:MAG: class I SAM-dependent methyltransferase [Bryobacteraceae bacterium]|jgi:SAM-dependent methyltransferase